MRSNIYRGIFKDVPLKYASIVGEVGDEETKTKNRVSFQVFFRDDAWTRIDTEQSQIGASVSRFRFADFFIRDPVVVVGKRITISKYVR